MIQRSPRPAAMAAEPTPDPEALEFVRFCHRRRHVGWPDLYDEMCAVAARGLFRGYGPDELSRVGIGFTLFEMSTLASLTARVVAEDVERRRIAVRPVRMAHPVSVEEPALVGEGATDVTGHGAEPLPVLAVVSSAEDDHSEPTPRETSPSMRLAATATA